MLGSLDGRATLLGGVHVSTDRLAWQHELRSMCGTPYFEPLHLALFPAGGPFLPSLSVNTYCEPKIVLIVAACYDAHSVVGC
jgi:hypothetical protein